MNIMEVSFPNQQWIRQGNNFGGTKEVIAEIVKYWNEDTGETEFRCYNKETTLIGMVVALEYTITYYI